MFPLVCFVAVKTLASEKKMKLKGSMERSFGLEIKFIPYSNCWFYVAEL